MNRREQLRRLYGFHFPDDLFRFWDFANRLQPLDPLNALWEPLQLRLVGPFEVLSGRFDRHTPRLSPLLHWRYYYDPPEFFTVLAGGVDRLHFGYYLDDPAAGSRCIASYYADDAFELSSDGGSLFEAVHQELEMSRGAPEEMDRLHRVLRRYPAIVDKKTARQAVIATTPEGMGIVAPPETYRPLSRSDKKLRSLLRKEDDPREIVEKARQALRDGFPATALKLGKELWPLTGKRKMEYAVELLDGAYAALGRDVLRTVLRTHREHRHLPSVDIFDAEMGNDEE